MLKSYKYRIYPTEQQKIYFEKTFVGVRFIYNKVIAEGMRLYHENEQITFKSLKLTTLEDYKKRYKWLNEIDTSALLNAEKDAKKLMKDFLENKTLNTPTFKTKKDCILNYKTIYRNNVIVDDDGRYVKIPKLKTKIKIVYHRNVIGEIKYITISKTFSNQYYITFITDIEQDVVTKKGKGDFIVGFKGYGMYSKKNDYKLDYNRIIRKSEKRLLKLQKDLDRKVKGSNNSKKMQIKLAKLHQKLTNQRNDFLHKSSNKIVMSNNVAYIKNHNRKFIVDKESIRSFKLEKMLTYKSKL